ncbi:MAG: sugar phosphate isomerase/epimerase [Armatimonadetes bacterium]|nr:sugar phosphate isomerase/epimerase [Candidatus Hippobium faecium]
MKKLIFLVFLACICCMVYAGPFSRDSRDYIDTLRLGTFSNSFKADFETSMEKAHALGMNCTELYNCEDIDVFTPFTLSQVIKINKICRQNGIKISSLCAEVGGFNIPDTKEAEKRVEAVKVCIDNACKLNVKMIQFHFGAINFSEDDPRYVGNKSSEKGEAGDPDLNLIKSIKELDDYCSEKGIIIAQETGPQEGKDLAEFIRKNNLKATKVNFDAANLVMYNFDEIQSIYDLGDLIVQIHVKDGIRDTVKTGYIEKPLGQGNVRWEAFVQALKKIGFRGDLIIEKEIIEDPDRDMAYAVNFLKN